MNFFKSVASFFLLTLLLGSCGASPGGCASPWAASGEQYLGNQAPNFVLQNLAGEKIELATLAQQKPTLLVFWASWCPSCVEEIPTLNEWAQKYPGIQILAVNVEEPAQRVKKFADKKKIRYSILLDPEGEVAHQYGLVGIPATVLLAKGGKVIYYGFTLPPNIEQLIKA